MAKIAIMGFGTVGSGVLEVLRLNGGLNERLTGEKIEVKYILDIRDFSDHPDSALFTKDVNVIMNDPEVVTVVEAMGGSHPAYEFTMDALRHKKNVVTSNKEAVANFGAEFLKTARENGVKYLFEASVGGGIPVIRALLTSLAGNRVTSVAGILNGTTNYILTEMFTMSKSFGDSLAEAQKLGYAERDPSADVDGLDAARKIAILASIITGHSVDPKNVFTEGIRNITDRDVSDAESAGYAVKLLGIYEECGDGAYVGVCPFFIGKSEILAGVSGVLNGIKVKGNAVGELHFTGAGAGKLPTASAMAADVINTLSPDRLSLACWDDKAPEGFVKPFDTRTGGFYLRFTSKVPDKLADSLGGQILKDDSLITSETDLVSLNRLCGEYGAKPVSIIRVYEG